MTRTGGLALWAAAATLSWFAGACSSEEGGGAADGGAGTAGAAGSAGSTAGTAGAAGSAGSAGSAGAAGAAGAGGNAGSSGTGGAGGDPRCQLPQEPGPCEAALPRWWFNAATGWCEQFTYGGCQGNDNNFETREDCESACASCENVRCTSPARCYYAGDRPFCGSACNGGACPRGAQCVCGASCPECDDCSQMCRTYQDERCAVASVSRPCEPDEQPAAQWFFEPGRGCFRVDACVVDAGFPSEESCNGACR